MTDRKLSNILHTEEQICLEISLEKKVTREEMVEDIG